jgi:hypothetical protein
VSRPWLVPLKRRMLAQAEWACEFCGWRAPKLLAEDAILSLHHVMPVYIGGSDDPDNLIILCPTCHALAHACEIRRKHADYDLRSGPETRDALLRRLDQLYKDPAGARRALEADYADMCKRAGKRPGLKGPRGVPSV